VSLLTARSAQGSSGGGTIVFVTFSIGVEMFEKIKSFLSETRAEMRKVTWPTRDELIESTKIVIIATFVITLFVGFIDQLLTIIIRRLLGW
jgi:preprotein translocase subunit SecE